MCGHFLIFLVYQWFVNILVFNIWFLKEEMEKNVRGVKKGTASLFFKICVFIYGCLGLCCCLWTFSHCMSRGYFFLRCKDFSLWWFLLWTTGSSAWVLVVVVYGLSCSVACGILLEQGLNPCPLPWQADCGVCVYSKLLHLCLTLCDCMDYSQPGSSVHGISQARMLEWIAMPSFRGSSWLSDRTCVSYVSYFGRWIP